MRNHLKGYEMSNAMLATYRKAHAKASDYIGKASVWLMLSALAFRDAMQGEEIKQVNGTAYPALSQFKPENIRALSLQLIDEAGLNGAAESKASARYKGNSDKMREIAREYRNNRLAETRDVKPAFAAAVLAAHWQIDATADYTGQGKVSIPAAWFLPINHAGNEAQALLSRNPLLRMLTPTQTSEKEEIPYLTKEGYADYLKETKRAEAAGTAKEAMPVADDFVAVLSVGVNATGLVMAAENLIAAREALNKALEAAKRASEASQAAFNAATVAAAAEKAGVDKATALQAAQASEAAKIVQAKAAEEAINAQTAAETAANVTGGTKAERKPGGSQSDKLETVSTVLTVPDAAQFLQNAAMRDDGKATFKGLAADGWKNLAAAIWLNPSLSHMFLQEREALLRLQGAAVAEKAKIVNATVVA
jgi:hypothetical protein